MTELTIDQIDELEGRDLDIAVAVHVMGWTLISPNTKIRAQTPKGIGYAPGIATPMTIPFYSKHIQAAWLVMEKMTAPPIYFKLDFDYMGWYCRFRETDAIECETAPLAICRAALKAAL